MFDCHSLDDWNAISMIVANWLCSSNRNQRDFDFPSSKNASFISEVNGFSDTIQKSNM